MTTMLDTYLRPNALGDACQAFVDTFETDFPAYDRPFLWKETQKLQELAVQLKALAVHIEALEYSHQGPARDTLHSIMAGLEWQLTPGANEILWRQMEVSKTL